MKEGTAAKAVFRLTGNHPIVPSLIRRTLFVIVVVVSALSNELCRGVLARPDNSGCSVIVSVHTDHCVGTENSTGSGITVTAGVFASAHSPQDDR